SLVWLDMRRSTARGGHMCSLDSTMRRRRDAKRRSVVLTTAALFGCLGVPGAHATDPQAVADFKTDVQALQQIREGRAHFRSNTFGSEAFWGDTLGLHEAIAGAANGGVGPGLSPKAALSMGLKVDVNALPQ